MNSKAHFSGKVFDYNIVSNKLNNDSISWYNSLHYINIENLFTPFFEVLDSSVETAFENNVQSISIKYPSCVFTKYYDIKSLITDSTNAIQYKRPYNKDTEYSNIWNKFNVNIIDENTGGLNDKLKPFCRKVNLNNQSVNILSIYYKDWFHLINPSNINDRNNENTLLNIINETIPIKFIEYLFTINGLNFREIVLNKFIGIKDVFFEKDSLEIIFF